MKSIMQRQIIHFERFSRLYRAIAAPEEIQHTLLAQIATARAVIDQSRETISSIAGERLMDSRLSRLVRDLSAEEVSRMKIQSTDPELSLLHWEAAQGMSLSWVLGICPLSAETRDRLFDRLHEETQRPSGKRDGPERP
ncbi:TetR family transcriptional regulator [Paraburkholderia caffeinilytica]|uniref:TetR transcriptional regulator CgmR-like C-terminal domain-containing protein n=1 Tax=Paraburkholderia caffeinilytica TaxID=1761016 RepID=A0ABQ1NBW9_9BURK|nr:hypothetical protein [Paraburkholderia caffeinilytica]AXL50378.1 TetR family transcriptional regulator [Paraburkholderia caffeinilytica]GGC67353.1 hypothetical protein GCM10011400_64090 [Paraburkholderia caffeinilytica]CAB3804195.1 hypothetical protein LMG28690_05967 [Paraburkholderia caffeinilytica]